MMATITCIQWNNHPGRLSIFMLGTFQNPRNDASRQLVSSSDTSATTSVLNPAANALYGKLGNDAMDFASSKYWQFENAMRSVWYVSEQCPRLIQYSFLRLHSTWHSVHGTQSAKNHSVMLVQQERLAQRVFQVIPSQTRWNPKLWDSFFPSTLMCGGSVSLRCFRSPIVEAHRLRRGDRMIFCSMAILGQHPYLRSMKMLAVLLLTGGIILF